MCGIAGIIRTEEQEPAQDREYMLRMLGMIRHRGPDQFGVYQDGVATLGSARLSIIDLSTGQQPITNEDGSLWVVYNGELFNYLELRRDLEKRGHRFQTNTDTEVLVHAYEEFGAGCVQKLNGQFAFAMWDANTRSVFLGRDRMGIRPLFYTRTSNGSFVFASECKALLAYEGVSAEIDPVSLDQCFIYWSALPGRTLFRGVREIPPGHVLLYQNGRECLQRYWDLAFPRSASGAKGTSRADDEAYLREFKELLTDATLIRLRADVPVGAYLSGGLDSSVITAIIARSNSRLKTFSVAFDDPEFDESSFQLCMSRHLGTGHEVVHVTHAEIARVFPDVIWHTETTLTRTGPAPMFLLSKLVRDAGFKVVLTGEGADELLAGYDVFKEAAIRRFWARCPESRTRPLLFRRIYSDVADLGTTSSAFLAAFFGMELTTDSPYYSHLVRWRNNARARRFFSDAVADESAHRPSFCFAPELPREFMEWRPLHRSQYLEATIFLSQYLLSSQGDRVAMGHSVESRMPFLDCRLVEFCNALPSHLKLQGLRDKRLLRLLGKEYLPAEICDRPKRPYRAPIHRSFFCKSAPDYVREMLSPERIKMTGLFKAGAVRRLVAKIDAGLPVSETDAMALAGILSTQLLHYQFVTNFRVAEPLSVKKDDIKFTGPK